MQGKFVFLVMTLVLTVFCFQQHYPQNRACVWKLGSTCVAFQGVEMLTLVSDLCCVVLVVVVFSFAQNNKAATV
jgi:hypothetical protein